MRKEKIPISDDYIAGFVDGEGCFSLSVRRDVRHERTSKAVYYSWKASFAINLRGDDFKILKVIQKRFKVGEVTYTQNKSAVRYQVSNLFELQDFIVPFFKKTKLFGKKNKDFELWVKAIKILVKYKKARGRVNITKGKQGFQKIEWSKKDIRDLENIQVKSSEYKSKQQRKWTNCSLGREGENKKT